MSCACLCWMVLTVNTLIPVSLARGQEQEPEQKTEEPEKKDPGWSNVADVGVVALAGNTSSITFQICDFKFEAHHSLVPMETFLRCAVTEPLAGPCVELLCDTIAVALRERCLAGALRQVLS